MTFLAYFTAARAIASSIAQLMPPAKNLDMLGLELEKNVEAMADKLEKHPKLSSAVDVSNTIAFGRLGPELVASHTDVIKRLNLYKARLAFLQIELEKPEQDAKTLMNKVTAAKSKGTSKKKQQLETSLDTLLEKSSDLSARVMSHDVLAMQLNTDLKKITFAQGPAILAMSTTLLSGSRNPTKNTLGAAVLDAAAAGDAVVAAAGRLSKEMA